MSPESVSRNSYFMPQVVFLLLPSFVFSDLGISRDDVRTFLDFNRQTNSETKPKESQKTRKCFLESI